MQFPQEKIVAARIGAEHDNYFMYAIKNKKLETLVFLLPKCPEIALDYKNNHGDTVLHLAAKSGDIAFCKAILAHVSDEMVKSSPDLHSEKMSDVSHSLRKEAFKLF